MIRKFKSMDLDDISRIWLSANIEAHDFIDRKYWEANYEKVRAMLPEAEIYVYEDDKAPGVVRGFTGVSGENYIAGIFVESGFRKKEIGKRLLNRVKERATESSVTAGFFSHSSGIDPMSDFTGCAPLSGDENMQSCGGLFLSVYEKNERARRFYEREGFSIKERRRDEATGEFEFLMEWKAPRLRIEKITENRKRYLELLLLADEEEKMIDRYLERGEMYALLGDRADGEALAVCVVTDEGDGVLEIKNLAVNPAFQKRGLGKLMIDFIISEYGAGNKASENKNSGDKASENKISKEKRFTTLTVGTGDSPATVPFYEKCGFKRFRIEKDFFTANYSKPICDGGRPSQRYGISAKGYFIKI